MRVTNYSMTQFIQEQIAKTNDRVARLQSEVATGQRIQHPSDDPEGAAQAAGYRSRLTAIDQYTQSATEAKGWLQLQESTLGEMGTALRQAHALGLQGNNPQSVEAREAVAGQIDAVRSHLLQLANTRQGSRYLFAGFRTTTPPFAESGGTVQYAGDTGVMTIALGDGQAMPLNISGAELCNMGGAADIFSSLSQLAQAVRTGDQTAIGTQLADLEDHSARVTAQRGQTGIRMTQAEMALSHLASSRQVLDDLLNGVEAADLSRTVVDLQAQQNVLQATSYVAMSLSRGGLLNWLQ